MTDGEVRSAKAMAEDPYWIWVRGEVEEGEQQFKQAFEEKVNKIKKAQEAQYGEYLQDKEARNKKAFAVLDVNGDGKLQEQEVVDALTPGHDKHFELREALGLMSESAKLYWQALQANRAAEEDDESILKLSDGSTVPAADLEKILKKHLDAVEYVMVVGSGKDFLSCMLTLKTKGSEAVARGEDPAALESAKDELAKEALELAQRFNSPATRVLDARQCQKFRGEGLLPLFAKANAEIKQGAQQVHGTFSCLPLCCGRDLVLVSLSCFSHLTSWCSVVHRCGAFRSFRKSFRRRQGNCCRMVSSIVWSSRRTTGMPIAAGVWRACAA